MQDAGIVLLGVAQQPLEIADIAIDRGAEFAVAILALAVLVERLLAVDTVEVASKHSALAVAEALPDRGRGAVIDGTRDLVEAETLAAACRLRHRRPRGKGVRPLRRIAWRIGVGQEVADRPSPPFAAALRLTKLGLSLAAWSAPPGLLRGRRLL